MTSEYKKRIIIKDDKIDLIALTKMVWEGRKVILYSVLIFVIVGLIIAFLSPPKFKSGATLLPAPENKSSNIGGLGTLAGMAGLNIGSMIGQTSGISADVYPEIIKSYPLVNELINKEFNFKGSQRKISLYEYIKGDTIESAGDIVSKYTFKLPWTIKDIIVGVGDVSVKEDIGVIYLSKDELSAHEYIRNILNVNVDINTGLITIYLEAEEPVLATQLVHGAIELLQKHISEHKTEKLRLNLEFIEGRYLERMLDFEKKQTEFLNYKDRHRGIVAERVDYKYQKLKDDYELAEVIYKELAKQFEQASIAIKEESPAFSVIDPPKVPYEKSSHGKLYYLIVFSILGLFFGITIIIGKSLVDILIDKIKKHA